MDPLYVGVSPRCGTFACTPTVALHYELRGAPEAPQKVVLIMGAFATRRCARSGSSCGHGVLTRVRGTHSAQTL
jgi:hypothetical protein